MHLEAVWWLLPTLGPSCYPDQIHSKYVTSLLCMRSGRTKQWPYEWLDLDQPRILALVELRQLNGGSSEWFVLIFSCGILQRVCRLVILKRRLQLNLSGSVCGSSSLVICHCWMLKRSRKRGLCRSKIAAVNMDWLKKGRYWRRLNIWFKKLS